MKSLIKMTLVSSAIVFALVGCDEKKANATNVTNENSKTEVTTNTSTTQNNSATTSNETITKDSNATTTNKVTISTQAQKEAYALGSSFATYMKSNLEQNEIKTDDEYLISGFNETFRNASQLTEDEVRTVIDEFSTRIQEESKARLEKEKTQNTEAGDKFRTEFAKKEGVKQTKSGLLYQIIQEGNGRHPTANDRVIVHYVGTLIDGRKFDSSYDRGETATFPLTSVIKGWTEGIQLIGVGGKIKLVVPPELGYGDQNFPSHGENAGIPPASTLVFEVELLGIDGDSNNDNDKNIQVQPKIEGSAD